MQTNAHQAFRSLDDIAPGDHICLLYDNDEDYRAVMVPFVRQGIEQNQKVLFVTGQRTAEFILRLLIRDESCSVQPAIDRGQLEILTERAAYFENGAFDPDAMIAMIARETDKAISAGYSALRVTGEMSWALGDVIGADRLVEYEIKLNHFYPESRALALCQYDMRRFDPDLIMNIFQAHPFAILGTDFCDNVYYLPPEELFSDKAAEFRLRRWINNLKTYQSEKMSLEETLVEKEQLMRELNHRVKNSLSLVLSLINMKARDSHSTTELAEIRALIRTMSLVHDKLHTDGHLSQIEFAGFAEELLRNVVSIYPGPPVTVDTDIATTVIEAKKARDLGFILNELVINAMKHGFTDEDKPRISVRFDRKHDSYTLTVSNNGAPFPEHVSLTGSDSGGTGTSLVSSIVEGLKGSIVLRRAPETRICLEFPVSSLSPTC